MGCSGQGVFSLTLTCSSERLTYSEPSAKSCFHFASCCSASVQLCVKYHADINAQDEDNGGTPLMYAIHNAHDAIVETLLQLGADMEHEEQQGYTPLMVACLSDNATACEMLLKNKAALDNTDSKGRTALSMACRYAPLDRVI